MGQYWLKPDLENKWLMDRGRFEEPVIAGLIVNIGPNQASPSKEFWIECAKEKWILSQSGFL